MSTTIRKNAEKPGKDKTKGPKQKTINLALQGGGAHGAFTWGVLDYILEDGRINVEGVTATSAGAMNAVAFAYGETLGGAETTREMMHDFWFEISKAGTIYGPVKRSPWEMAKALNPFGQNWALNHSASFAMFEAFKNVVSPYQFNPMNVNPLKDVLERVIDFDAIHACDCLELFICTTNVRTGTPKVFRNKEITIDVLLASAALPFLFQAVDIDGKAYWDGGYMGNPALWPLFYHAKSRDVLIVHLNPIVRDEVPTEAYTIENRVNEINFNSSLLKELRAISFVKKLINEDMLKDEYKDQYKDILLHAIRADEVLCDLSIASKFDTDWNFLKYLRDLGRDQAKIWIKKHYKDIGEKASVDIEKDYLAL